MFSPDRFGSSSANSSGVSNSRGTSPGRTNRVGQGGVGLASGVPRSSVGAKSTTTTGSGNSRPNGQPVTNFAAAFRSNSPSRNARTRVWGADGGDSQSTTGLGSSASTRPSNRWTNTASASTGVERSTSPSTTRLNGTGRSTSPSATSSNSTGWRSKTPDKSADNSAGTAGNKWISDRSTTRSTSPSRLRDLETNSERNIGMSWKPNVGQTGNRSPSATRSRSVSPTRGRTTETRTRSPSVGRDFSVNSSAAGSTSPARDWSSKTGLRSTSPANRTFNGTVKPSGRADPDSASVHSTNFRSTSPLRGDANIRAQSSSRDADRKVNGNDSAKSSGANPWGVALKSTRNSPRLNDENNRATSTPKDQDTTSAGTAATRSRSVSPSRRIAANDNVGQASSRLSRSTEIKRNRNADTSRKDKDNSSPVRGRRAHAENDLPKKNKSDDRTNTSNSTDGTARSKFGNIRTKSRWNTNYEGGDSHDKEPTDKKDRWGISFRRSAKAESKPSFVRPKKKKRPDVTGDPSPVVLELDPAGSRHRPNGFPPNGHRPTHSHLDFAEDVPPMKAEVPTFKECFKSRQHLGAFMTKNHNFHIFMVCMILVDIFVVMAELIVDLEVILHHECLKDEDCPKAERGPDGESCTFDPRLTKCHFKGGRNKCVQEGVTGDIDPAEVLHKLGITVLSFFVLEVLIKLWALRLSFFHHKLEVFDSIVVIISFSLDVAVGGHKASEGIALLILLRLWRVTRILNGITVAIETREEEKRHHLKDKASRANSEIERLQNVVRRLKTEVGGWREHAGLPATTKRPTAGAPISFEPL